MEASWALDWRAICRLVTSQYKKEVKNVALNQCPFQKLPSHVVKFLNLSVPGFFCPFTATATATATSVPSRYPPNWAPGKCSWSPLVQSKLSLKEQVREWW